MKKTKVEISDYVSDDAKGGTFVTIAMVTIISGHIGEQGQLVVDNTVTGDFHLLPEPKRKK
jgi:hypothetical protein